MTPPVAVVIPVGAGREENLMMVLRSLAAQTVQPAVVVVVEDGPALGEDLCADDLHPLRVRIGKHVPGQEQPRNVGVRVMRQTFANRNISRAKIGLEEIPVPEYVWFLDSDVIVGPDCLERISSNLERGAEPRILVLPYDWLPAGRRPNPCQAMPEDVRALHNDPRWSAFYHHGPIEAIRGDLSAGLACFSGNLVWPIEEFERVGGFWSEIHHGRCEDGELGLRAVAMDVPISFEAEARGWHLHHKVNQGLALERNARDVPMLNARHPWVQSAGVLMVDRDGKAFDVHCPGCGQTIPTIAWWEHVDGCIVSHGLPVS